MTEERCSLCGCQLHRSGIYAENTLIGRSHATSHHYIAERYFGRTQNKPDIKKEGVFDKDPWGMEGTTGIFC